MSQGWFLPVRGLACGWEPLVWSMTHGLRLGGRRFDADFGVAFLGVVDRPTPPLPWVGLSWSGS